MDIILLATCLVIPYTGFISSTADLSIGVNQMFELLDGTHVVATFTYEEDAMTTMDLWVKAFGNTAMSVREVA